MMHLVLRRAASQLSPSTARTLYSRPTITPAWRKLTHHKASEIIKDMSQSLPPEPPSPSENQRKPASRHSAAWLAAAEGIKDLGTLPPIPIIELMDDLDEGNPSDGIHTVTGGLRRRHPDLLTAVAGIDPASEVLHIAGEVPSDEQWRLLAGHFTGVRKLYCSTGWNERWNDGAFPLGWPLELLVISDACGELIGTPAVLEGRVAHLVLYLTCGLRFEGPSTEELTRRAFETARAEKEKKGEGGEEADTGGPLIACLPDEVNRWMAEKYSGETTFSTEVPPGAPVSRLKTLTILENDAIEEFIKLSLAKPHLVAGLESLTIRSTLGNDLNGVPEDIFLQILPTLDELKTLRLSLRAAFVDAEIYGKLWEVLPPNLETLRFRGPTSMADDLEGWTKAFENPEFLPQLKRLSFVLDLRGTGPFEKEMAPLEELKKAKAACERLWKAAEARGVAVEEFKEPWADVSKVFKPVDSRWDDVDEVDH